MPSKKWYFSRLRSSFLYGTLASFALISPALAQQPTPDPSPIPSPSQPPPASPNAPTAPVPPSNPPAGASPSSHLMRTWRRLTYTCDGDTKVVVNLHSKLANVVFKGHTYKMKQVDDSEGQKFSDGGFVWTDKDGIGSLEHLSKSGGNKKSLAAGCHLQSAGTSPPNSTPAANPPNHN